MARKKQEPDVLPIRIRANLVVQVIGLPHDLTAAEADKIAGVVVALGGRVQADPWAERPVPSLADVVRDDPEHMSDEDWLKTVPLPERRAGE